MATHGGAADDYYNNAGAQPQMQYPPQSYNHSNEYQGGPEPKYQQPPPNYGPNDHNTIGPPPVGDGKQTYDQQFKLERPKYNDLPFGILVRDTRKAIYCSNPNQ